MTLDLTPLAGERIVLRENHALEGRTTLRIGGPARVFAEVESTGALAALLRFASERGLPVLPLGKGSNILVPDAGFPGIAFVLSGDFSKIVIDGNRVSAGGGASLMSLAVLTKNAGLKGLENLSGIPSSVGGAIRINAGAYGGEIFDVLREIELVSRAGDVSRVDAKSIRWGYRWTELMERTDIVTAGVLELEARPKEEVDARFREVSEKRRNALPKKPNAGSIFKNPEGQYAGKLLEACGLKGRQVGGAQISEVHANVIVNLGGATAADVRALMAEMQAVVHERFGVELVPEVEVL